MNKQTGAGKTFTMTGDSSSYPQRGIVPRAIHHIFCEVDAKVDKIYKIKVSYLEIYNETVLDLLANDPEASDNLHILEENNMTTVSFNIYFSLQENSDLYNQILLVHVHF